MSLEIDQQRLHVDVSESIRYHKDREGCETIGLNSLCCSGKTCCRMLCCGSRKVGIPIRAHPRIGFIFMHFICILIAFIFGYSRVDF